MRRPRVTSAVLCAMMLSVPGIGGMGCEWNRSSIHTRLSPAELDNCVRNNFSQGLSAAEVQHRLRSLWLKGTASSIPSRDGGDAKERGIAVRVRPPGLHGTFLRHPYGGRLYFWFGQEDGLEQAGYEGLLGTKEPQIRHSRMIALEERAP
jgi:hypothetical protein